MQRADSLPVPIVLKSGSLSLVETSGPVIGLNRVCFTFFTLGLNLTYLTIFCLFYSISCERNRVGAAAHLRNHSISL